MAGERRWQALRWSDSLAVLGLYLFSYLAWLPDRRAYLGLVLIAFACVLERRQVWLAIRRAPLVWVAALAVAYILLRAVAAVLADPDSAHYQWTDAIRLAALCLFPLVAWSVAGNQRRIIIALGLAMAGFVVGRIDDLNLARIEDPSWEAFERWWRSRDPMGMGAVIALGEYAAVAALGMLLMAPRLWKKLRTRRWRWAALSAWMLLTLLLLEIVVISQARGVWIAFVAVAIPLAVIEWPRFARQKRRTRVAQSGSALVVLVIFSYVNGPLITSRLALEHDTYEQLISGNIAQTPAVFEDGQVRPFGLRIHMLVFGLQHWKEKPILGFGPGATTPLIRAADGIAFNHHPDLHNVYIEVLLRLGLVGAGLAAACLWLVWASGWRAYRAGLLDRDVFLVLTAGLVLYLLAGLTNVRLLDHDGCFYWLLFGGAMASFGICPRPSSPSDPPTGVVDQAHATGATQSSGPVR